MQEPETVHALGVQAPVADSVDNVPAGQAGSGPSDRPVPGCCDAQGFGKRVEDCWGAASRVYHKIFRAQEEPRVDFAFILLALVIYGVLFFAIGSVFLPGHAAWATLLLWASSQVGAFIAYQLYLPRVIGMLGAGMVLENVPWDAISAFPPIWGTRMRAAALATIFLRCGLELDFGTMRRYKVPALRLALLPGLVEAFYDGGLAVAIFNMPVLLAFTMGFILKAVGPGLVVPAMFRLQREGWGKDQGIPPTVVIAASFDDIVAITGYAIFSNIAITGGSGNLGWQIASGPVQVVFGILGGLLLGCCLGATKIFNTRFKRILGTYGSALLLMFFLEHWDLLSGGALGALILGLVASNAWEHGFPRCASIGACFVFSPEIERILNIIWVWVMEPMLFVTIGASINFSELATGTIPKSLLIVGTGVILRMICTFIVMSGFGYTKREKFFYAIAWTPKATVQAALSAAPLTMITTYKVNEPNYDEWLGWGNDILTTGIFAIIVCGTLGVMAIHFSAPHMLEKAEEEPRPLRRPSLSAKGPRAVPVAIAVGTPSDDGSIQAPAGMPRRPSSAGPLSIDSAAPIFEDYELVAEFIDSIRQLTSAVKSEKADKDVIFALSDHVLWIQQRIETEVGRREPSVRELFRTASQMVTTQRPVIIRTGSLARTRGGDGPRQRSKAPEDEAV